MVELPANTRLSIRQRSIEMDGPTRREAIVSFEMFAYPQNNGGQDCPVIVLSKIVPYISKDPTSTLTPDYDRMVIQAASELAKDFTNMTNILKEMGQDKDA